MADADLCGVAAIRIVDCANPGICISAIYLYPVLGLLFLLSDAGQVSLREDRAVDALFVDFPIDGAKFFGLRLNSLQNSVFADRFKQFLFGLHLAKDLFNVDWVEFG